MAETISLLVINVFVCSAISYSEAKRVVFEIGLKPPNEEQKLGEKTSGKTSGKTSFQVGMDL